VQKPMSNGWADILQGRHDPRDLRALRGPVPKAMAAPVQRPSLGCAMMSNYRKAKGDRAEIEKEESDVGDKPPSPKNPNSHSKPAEKSGLPRTPPDRDR